MSTLNVTWLGQASYLYEFPGGPIVCIDPYLSHAASGGRTRPRLTPIHIPAPHIDADLVIITHDHSDHFDEYSLRPIAERPNVLFLGPGSCKAHWLKMELPDERFLALDQGQSIEMAGLKLTATFAEHDSGGQRDAIGIIIEHPALTVYQVGDSEYAPPLLEAVTGLQPHLMTVPINGRLGNMNATEAAQLAELVQPQVVVPMHYGMFAHNTADPQDFVNACRERNLAARVMLLQAGQETWLQFDD